MFNQPPTSGRFLIPDSGQAACSHLTSSVLLYGQTGNHTYLSCRNLILEEYVSPPIGWYIYYLWSAEVSSCRCYSFRATLGLATYV